MTRVLITGSAGFIGHHLARRLTASGAQVTGIDIALPEYSDDDCAAFSRADLRLADCAAHAFEPGAYDEVYALASDMGGMGYLHANDAAVLRNNLQITLNTLEGARRSGCRRLLFSSSACVYPE